MLHATFALALLLALPSANPRPASPRPADEGMWTFDNPPVQRLRDDHGFEVDAGWMDHVRLSSVRVNDGGSASFVSPDGLVLTNHHVAFNAIQKLSSEDEDLIASGFYAPTLADERRCTDLELNVLDSIEDVTARVQGAVADDADEAAARRQRSAEIARITQEETERTGLRCDVVTLYRGGAYALYRYRKYTDVRLVFAPEAQAAFFGGDPDNFTFPRYALDMTLLRVYEDGAPLSTPHHLRWSADGVDAGDLVFVSGNPGSTGRLNTVAQLEYLRDHHYPRILRHLGRRRAVLSAYAALGAEQERRAKRDLFSIDNSIKALGGYLDSLRDPAAMERKRAEEQELRRRVAADAELAAAVGDPWAAIARAQGTAAEIGARAYYASLRGSRLFDLARRIVRLTAEVEKPNDERLPGYRESQLESLKLSLFSPAPVYADLEEVAVAGALEELAQELGRDDPFVAAALGDGQPAAVAAELVAGTRLADPDVRRALVEGGRAAVEASDDPMVRLARDVDGIARELERRDRDEIDSVESKGGEAIARARFAVHGSSVYPDATFTLRLSYGVVQGYEAAGWNIPFKTTFHGLFERAAAFDHEPPYHLADRWRSRASDLALDTPFDFVCTADIIGGNSGSPVIDRRGELVGLIFDGNIQSLGNRFVFDDSVARAVAVDARGMLAALRDVYGADRLVAELQGRGD